MKTMIARHRHAALVALCAAALFSPVVSAQTPGAGHGAGGHAGMKMDGSKEMMKDNSQQMMSASMTGKIDIDFAMMMRMHHMGALQMAQIELRDGKDARMREMAKKIIAGQKKEIAQFEAFLAKQGHPVAKMK